MLTLAALLLCLAPPEGQPAGADTPSAPITPPSVAVTSQPGARDPAPPATHPAYGAEGGWWMTLGGAGASDFDDARDSNVHVALTTFIAPKFEIGGEADLWYFNQPGNNAYGASATLLLRYHVIASNDWTVFIDGGIGLLGASDEVPDGGTGFDFMPRAGGGFTRRLTDSGLRLMMGARWHHISNARILGDDQNPSRDGLLIYAGVTFPF